MDKFVTRFRPMNYGECIIKEELIISDSDNDVKDESIINQNFAVDAQISGPNKTNGTTSNHAERASESVKNPNIITAEQSKVLNKVAKAYCGKCKVKSPVKYRKARCVKCKAQLTYRCENCDTSYKYFTDLNVHVQAKHAETLPMHLCRKCGKTYTYKRGLLHHQKVDHRPSNSKQCTSCSKSFSTVKGMKQHQAQCGKNPMFKCDQCSFTSNYKSNLIGHQKDKHSTFEESCKTCGKIFKNRRSFKRHVLIYCNKKKSFECDHCLHRVYRKDEMVKHLEQVHAEYAEQSRADNSRACKYCNVVLQRYLHMRYHVERCEFAPLELRRKSKKDEQPNLALALKNLSKAHCLKCNVKKPVLYRVRRCHKCKTLVKFVCESCRRNFSDSYMLREHLRIQHVMHETCYRCDQCDLTYTRKKNLKAHQQAYHSARDQLYECERCRKQYRNKLSLSKHKVSCGTEPKFHCDKCPYKTHFKASLVDHFKAKRGTCI